VRCPAALALVAALPLGCAPIVRYTDELTSVRSGRTVFVRAPATLGGVVGFVAGVPLDIVVVPAPYVVYVSQDEVTRDPLSIFLFPSVVLSRACTLIGAPIDLIEYGLWRWWQPEEALTPEARERLEAELDEGGWPKYPVTPLYPTTPKG